MQVEPFQINFMVGQAFAIAAASYFPLLFMSAWWRGMTMKRRSHRDVSGRSARADRHLTYQLHGLEVAALDGFWRVIRCGASFASSLLFGQCRLAIALMVVVLKLTKREVPSDVRMKMLVLHAPEKLG